MVLLPGLLADERSFATHGLVRAARSAGVASDLIGVRARLRHYVGDDLVDHVRAELLPDLRSSYARVDVLGVSLGGFGALELAAAEPDAIDGVVVLSPFVGRRSVKWDIARDGGVDRWHPPRKPGWDQRLWTRVQALGTRGGRLPPTWVGYGEHDVIVGSPVPLLPLVPADHVVATDGGHGWRTWRALLGRLVQQGALSAEPEAEPADREVWTTRADPP